MTKIAEKALSLKSRDIYIVYIGYGGIRYALEMVSVR